MRAGRLNRKVTVQSLAATQSTVTGEMHDAWATVGSVWAEVAPLSGREAFIASQVRADVDTLITIRYATFAVVPTMRIVKGTTYYDIQSALDPLDRKREIRIMCKKGNT